MTSTCMGAAVWLVTGVYVCLAKTFSSGQSVEVKVQSYFSVGSKDWEVFHVNLAPII